jgi:hypothetical protein
MENKSLLSLSRNIRRVKKRLIKAVLLTAVMAVLARNRSSGRFYEHGRDKLQRGLAQLKANG